MAYSDSCLWRLRKVVGHEPAVDELAEEAGTNPGNREVTWLESTPFLSPSSGSGVKGRFASNSGGSATGQIMAICLK